MAKPRLEVRLKEKALMYEGNNIQLDDSLCDAHGFERDGDDYLELRYNNTSDGFTQDESGRVHDFLESQGLEKYISVAPCPEGGEHPTVALYGSFRPVVYR